MREFSELKVKQAAKTALSSDTKRRNDASDEDDLSMYDEEIKELLRTQSEVEALEKNDASVNEKHIKDQTDVGKPKTKRQRYDDEHIEIEFLITHDIEESGYRYIRRIVNKDKSIIREYVKESEETYRYVVSKNFIRVKEGNYPGIFWTINTKRIPDSVPCLSIAQAAKSKFQRVYSPATWGKLKKQCIYNPPRP